MTDEKDSQEKKKEFFSQEKRDLAFSKINEKWKFNPHCECCGAQAWTLPADITTSVIYEKGIMLGKAYPQIQVICSNCGNTKFFNAMILGIVDSEKEGGEDAE